MVRRRALGAAAVVVLLLVVGGCYVSVASAFSVFSLLPSSALLRGAASGEDSAAARLMEREAGAERAMAEREARRGHRMRLQQERQIEGIVRRGEGDGQERACDAKPAATWCNTALTINERVAALVAELTLEEKISLMSNTAAAVPRLGLPAYQWWGEALHGVAYSPSVSFLPPTTAATSFPQIVTTANSFHPEIAREIGKTVSTEARAFANAQHAGLTYWTPNLNIFRDPRWGRGQETPGEDVYYTSQYVKNLISGLQNDGQDAPEEYLKISACCKHFAGYSLEGGGDDTEDRHHFNAVITDQDLADTYLPAFQTCVADAQTSCVMCSYNEVNSVPSCANKELLVDTARGAWGFDGYITSDCGAISDIYETHAYADSPEQACAMAVQAGTDLDCGSYYAQHLQDAVEQGEVSEDGLDVAVGHLFRTQMRLGMFDPAEGQEYMQIGMDQVNTDDAQQLALQAALEGIVLLKNEGGVLPLDPNSLSSIALVGPNANAKFVMQGNYFGHAPYLVSPKEGFEAFSPEVLFSLGVGVTSDFVGGIPAAVDAARTADATIIVLGGNEQVEREGQDRSTLALPGRQRLLLERVSAESKGPVILVLMSGGCMDLSFAETSDRVSAILHVGYPGQEGGNAIAQVVYGQHSVSGRLAQTFYREAYIKAKSMEDMNMRPVGNVPGRGYRFLDARSPFVLYPFAHGLSYTSFEYAWTSNAPPESFAVKEDSSMTIEVTVTNSGNADVPAPLQTSDHSTLLFLSPPLAGKAGRPVKQLRGMEFIENLAVGASASVPFTLTSADFSLVNEDGTLSVVPGRWTVQIGTGSMGGTDSLSATIDVQLLL